MPRNFARYEQFLRIHALYDTLAAARQPIDDATLIGRIKERLGLKNISVRTLHRDCDFLLTCGYPIERLQLSHPRRNGWALNDGSPCRSFPGDPPTLLELVAFSIARDLLASFRGTVVWTGIESLRAKLEAPMPPDAMGRVANARAAFHVATDDAEAYAKTPRLISALGTAISERQEVDLELHHDGRPRRRTIQPVLLHIRLPRVHVIGWPSPTEEAPRPLAFPLESITRATILDNTFEPRPIDEADLAELMAAAT